MICRGVAGVIELRPVLPNNDDWGHKFLERVIVYGHSKASEADVYCAERLRPSAEDIGSDEEADQDAPIVYFPFESIGIFVWSGDGKWRDRLVYFDAEIFYGSAFLRLESDIAIEKLYERIATKYGQWERFRPSSHRHTERHLPFVSKPAFYSAYHGFIKFSVRCFPSQMMRMRVSWFLSCKVLYLFHQEMNANKYMPEMDTCPQCGRFPNELTIDATRRFIGASKTPATFLGWGHRPGRIIMITHNLKMHLCRTIAAQDCIILV